MIELSKPSQMNLEQPFVEYLGWNTAYADAVHFTDANGALLGDEFWNIPLSPRIKHCLRLSGIVSLQTLLYMSVQDILNIRSLGQKSFFELCDFLKHHCIIVDSDTAHRYEEETAQQKFISNMSDKIYRDLNEHFHDSIPLIIVKDIVKSHLAEIYEKVDFETFSFSDVKKALTILYSDDRLLEVIESLVGKIVESYKYQGCLQEDVFAKLPKSFACLDFAESKTDEYLSKNKSVDIWYGKYYYKYPSVCDAIVSDTNHTHGRYDAYEGTKKSILWNKLSGKTLEEAGGEWDLTRERARQIVSKFFAEKPCFYEDRYHLFYDRYEFDKESFCTVFEVEEYVYNYLKTDERSNKKSYPNRKELSEFSKDAFASDILKKKVFDYLHKDYIKVYDELVPCNRLDIAKAILKHNHSNSTCSVEKFYCEYVTFCDDNNLSKFVDKSIHTFEARVVEKPYVLLSAGKRVRYCSLSEKQIESMLTSLDFNSYMNLSVSAYKVFKDNKDLMDKYDIRSEFELHNVMRKYSQYLPKFVSCDKMPMLNVGEADRERQVVSLLRELTPISKNDFIESAHSRFGVDRYTFGANWLKYIDVYFVDSMYDMKRAIANV